MELKSSADWQNNISQLNIPSCPEQWVHVNISDDDFFRDLCDKYYEPIYFFSKKLIRGQNSFLFEECVQNTFLEARRQVVKLRNHPNIPGWLYKTARNQANTLFRKEYLKKKYEIILDDDLSNILVYHDRNIDKLLEEKIDIAELAVKVLNMLNLNEYSLYNDYFKDHMSIMELADEYNISVTAVTTRIYRIKKKIKINAHNLLEKEI